METIKNHIKGKYNLSNYQIAQLVFLMKTIGSELSKILIMGIIFHHHLLLYMFALFIMLCLRSTTGGLHFYTYTGCLVASTLYLGTALLLTQYVSLNCWIQTLLLAGSILICHIVGPVTSKYRSDPVSDVKNRWRTFACKFILIYALAMYIMPENIYLTAGFWIIILHSLQLIAAKIRKKGDYVQ